MSRDEDSYIGMAMSLMKCDDVVLCCLGWIASLGPCKITCGEDPTKTTQHHIITLHQLHSHSHMNLHHDSSIHRGEDPCESDDGVIDGLRWIGQIALRRLRIRENDAVTGLVDDAMLSLFVRPIYYLGR